MQYIERELRNHRYPNCAQIAAYFDVSSRSIQRDIDVMRDQLGAPIAFNRRRNGYCFTEHWVFDLASIPGRTQSCLQSAMAGNHSRHEESLLHGDASGQAGGPAPARQPGISVNSLFEPPSLDQPDRGCCDQRILSQFEAAIVQRQIVTFSYHSSLGDFVTERRVRPYRLHYDQSGGLWYLIACCEEHKKIRAFDISRVFDPVLTEDSFMLPSLFGILDYVDRLFHHRNSTFPFDISVRFTPHQSRWIRLRKWHPSQKFEEHEDGSLTLSLTLSSLEAVKRWVMHFGAQAEVCQPRELRNMVKQEVTRMGKIYGVEYPN